MPLSRSRFKQIMKRLQGKRVLILGDVILDRYVWGNVSRISQEAPVPVVEVKKESFRLGGGANVANNLRALGIEPMCAGVVGRDGNAAALRKLFREKGIRAAWLFEDPARPTTVKTRLFAQNQQIVRMDQEDSQDLPPAFQDKLLHGLKKAMERAHAIIISDYAKGVITPHVVESIVAFASKKGIFVAVDPKEKHFSAYRGVSLITPNQKEAEVGSGIKIHDSDSLKAAGWKLKETLDVAACLITLGEQGMALFEAPRQFTHIPTMASEVYDVTGAGDTVISVFTAAVAGKAGFKEAAMISNYAAGIVIREIGTASATPREIESAMFGK
jgi:D-glycero-beta-D-manno-heptose-7-phosphate kinase